MLGQWEQLVGQITAALLPKLKESAVAAAEAAEPMIRRVVVEEVLPKFGFATVLGLAAGAAIAAAIGAHYATRRNPARLPVRRRYTRGYAA